MSQKSKKLSAMDLLLKSEALKPALSQNSALSRNAVANLKEGVPVEISATACRPWSLADRPATESGHKAELIQSFQTDRVGQLQPVIVRPVSVADDPAIHYEVICGCVRWMAAKELGLPLRAIVRELNDREAYNVMSIENRQRQNISDWARAKSYQRALASAVFESAGQLAEAEGISKSKLSLYLGFADLPDRIAEAFTAIAKLSYRTGYVVARACKTVGVETMLPLVPRIEAGEISRDDLEQITNPVVRAVPTTPAEPPIITTATLPTVTAETSATDLDAPPKTVENLENTSLRFSMENRGGEQRAENQRSASVPPLESAKESHARKTLVAADGTKLFTYHRASRGWLLRIDAGISTRIDEQLLQEIGNLIAARLG